MRILIFLFLLITTHFNGLSLQQNSYKVSGIIKDANTKETIVGVSITWNNGTEGVVSGINGEFSFNLSPATHTIIISAVGKMKISKELHVKKDIFLQIEMEDDVRQLSEIRVEGSSDVSDLRSATMGVERLSMKSIAKMPPMMGEVDVIKSVITLPGISSIGEGSGGINVRGGSVGQNLVLLDGAPIYFTSHLFGFFSVFNQDVVENVTLYKGSIPARYGGRISSVLEVETKDPIVDSLKFSGGIGLISGRFTVEAPVVKDKIGVMLSGRSTYSDWLLNAVKNPQLENSSASFYDLNAKTSFRLNDKNKLSLSTYIGADEFAFDADTTYRYGNKSATLQYLHEFNESINISTLLTYASNYSEVKGRFSNQQFDLTIDSENYTLKSYLGVGLASHYLEAGLEVNQYKLNPGDLSPSNDQSIINKLKVQNDIGREFAFFAEDNISAGDFKFIIGLRYNIFNKLGPYTSYDYASNETKNPYSIVDTTLYATAEKIISFAGLEPRFSMNYAINDKQSLKLGFQRTRQNLHLIANNAAVVPTDIYMLSNKYLKPQIGDQASLGYFRNFSKGIFETSIEVYYKEVQNTIDFKDGAILLLNKLMETEIVSGKSESYGAELSVNKTVGELTGRISYTYSRSFFQADASFEEENINKGNPYPAFFDKPHDVTAIVSYQMSDDWSFNVNFTYSSGRPVSVPISKYDVGDIAVAEFSERNQYRIPDYHRMDASLTYDPIQTNKNFKSSWTIGLYNVYGRKNAFSLFFRDQNGAPPQGYRLAILGIPFPSLTYNFKF